MDVESGDDRIHDGMNEDVPPRTTQGWKKSTFHSSSPHQPSPSSSSAPSSSSPQRSTMTASSSVSQRCHRKLSLCHVVAKTLLILSAVCFFSSSPANGQEPLELKYRLEEEQGSGTYVGNVIDDASLGTIYGDAALQQIQFRFLRQQNLFVMDNSTGIIRTSSQIDREAICPSQIVCDIRIDVVLQPAQFFRIIRASVTILDINDNWPTFDRDEQVVEVSESAAVGTILLVPSAVDLDSPEFSIRSYRLVSDFERFKLVGGGMRRSDGASDSKLMLTRSLDREELDRYNLQIVAVDGGYPPNSGSMDVVVHVLDVNDNIPVFEKDNYTVAVRENVQRQTTILEMRAVDADIGLNGEVTYSMSLPSSAAYGNLFGIDNSSGDLYVKGNLDFEENSVYFLTVVARDRGSDSTPVSTSVTVLVGDDNDNAPEITISTLSPSTDTAEISENSALSTFVAHLTITDKDSGENGRFECQLNDTHFRIVESYGSEFQIVTAALVDREVQSSYGLSLTCTDLGEKPKESVEYLRVVIVDVNDNDPVFSQSVYRAELIENNYMGAVLMHVNATDRDSDKNGQIVYSLSGDSAHWFHVQPDTGLVTAAIAFDREKGEVVRFQVVAHDQGIPPRSSSAEAFVTILDVNDEKPVFSHPAYSFAVLENLPPGAEVGAVAAHDRDSSVYGEVTYSILPTDGSDLFDVDHKSGLILTMKVLDRETVSVYYLTVIASDRGIPPLSSSASVTVYVTDENDNSPVFDYPAQHNNTIYISNQTPKGHVITRIGAHDLDVGQNGKIVYDIVDESKTELFDVDMELGTVLVHGDLTDLDGQQHSLEFVAKDDGSPPRFSFARLNIVVNRSVVFAPPDKSRHTLPQSVLIIVVMAIISGIVIIVLILAIVFICRKDREKQTHSYNCRTETLKMFSKTTTVAGTKQTTASDVSGDFSGTAEHGSCVDDDGGSKKELNLRMMEDDFDGEISDERLRSPRSGSTSYNPYVIQNPQASSSLLRMNNSSAKSSSTAAAAAPPPHNTMSSISKFGRGDYHGSQTVPLLQQSKEVEVNRLIRALNDNDVDSIHSGEGSNTDSGHGPSEEGESGAAALAAAHTARNGLPDPHGNTLQVDFSKASKPEGGFADDNYIPQQQFNAGYHSDSRIASGIGPASSHRYPSQKPSAAPLSTFDPRCFYEPGAAIIRMAAEDAAQLTPVRGGSGYMQSTPGPHPMRLNTRVDPLTSPVYRNGFPHSVGYENGRLNFLQDDCKVDKYQPSPGSVVGQPFERVKNQKNSQDYDQNMSGAAACWPDRQRPLNNISYSSDSDCTGGIEYSCADMSDALHEMRTPMAAAGDPSGGSRRNYDENSTTVTSGSYIIDPYDLCDQIDDLFFRDKLPISYARPR